MSNAELRESTTVAELCDVGKRLQFALISASVAHCTCDLVDDLKLLRRRAGASV
jgi:hypothetical protein